MEKNMTQEDKELLLKDLSGRLRYGVMLWHSLAKKPFKLKSITHKNGKTYVQEEEGGPLVFDEYGCWRINGNYFLSEFIKPYLRPMSSMTEEENKTYRNMFPYGLEAHGGCFIISPKLYMFGIQVFSDAINWLNEHHFDYHGLIEKGLAIEVTEENNPYKD